MLSIRLLGPLEVERGGALLSIRGRQTQALLVRLALDPGRVVSADGLIDALWGDDPPAGVTNALQVKVSELRRAIGTTHVVSQRPGYLLDVPATAIDALVAEALIMHARRVSADDPDAASRKYADALAMWRGPALASVTQAPFAARLAMRWDELRLAAVEERARIELAAGRTRPLIAELEVAVAEHPLRELLVEVLMRALAAEGRQVAALAVYRDLRNRLVDSLGIDPSPRLQELERQVLLQDPEIVPSAAGVEISQVAPEQAPMSGRGRVRLPHPVSSFVPRSDDVTAVTELLLKRRLVTITGPGGVGKTRLAIEVAQHLQIPTDGIWFVPLESATSSDHVVDALATVLEVVGNDARRSLVDRLSGADLLIVLDNCEHLDDDLATLIAALLQDAPRVRCLATSQRALGIQGEALWLLGPLTRTQAVELFVERARDVAPHASLDDRELVDSLCAQLDDLPLAIELAAGRCGVLSVREIADRLKDRFSLLRDAGHTRSPRQQTLVATISWSYDLLFPDAQLALLVIAGFVGGAPLIGIEAVLTDLDLPQQEILDLVTQLVDRSLVVVDRSGDSIRYGVLEGVRSFAVGQAVRHGHSDAIAAAHAAWVVSLAAAARSGVRGPDQRRWLESVRAERANIDAALLWMGSHKPWHALLVVADLCMPWMMLGDSQAGAGRALRSLEGATADAPPDQVALAESCAAQLLARSGSTNEAVLIGERAAARIGHGRSANQMEVTSILGRVLMHAGRLDEGRRLVAEAADGFAEVGDKWGQAMASVSLAWALSLSGRSQESASACHAALAALASMSEGWVTHSAHRLLGVLAAEVDDHETALAEYGAALAVARSMGSATDAGQILVRLARVQLRLDDVEAASTSLNRAAELSRLAGDPVTAEAVRTELEALELRVEHEPIR